MLVVAREDVPIKVGSGWNTSYRCRYSGFVRSAVEGGILKVTLYDPDAMRLGGTLPVYEIFMEKEKQRFLTYDRSHDKWRTAKIDCLEWQAKGSNNVWISAVDDAQIRQYLASDEKSVYQAILKFQRAVRDAELERRHRKETDPWDAELAQTPPLPKDWERWVNMGLSEAILEKFIGKGWLHSYMDIFALDKHRSEIVQMEGFGEKSWQNLWEAIQHSRITTFEQYLTAMDIPMVGSAASKAICQRFRGNLVEFETAVCQSFDFTQLPDFGETLHRNICQWFRSEENWTIWTELRRFVCIKTYRPPATSTDMGNPFVGKTLVVTGKVEPYTRDGINAKIESLGAHACSSVSSKTDYLICGENAGSKLAKAQELGIKILSPDEFFRMAGESA